MYHRIRTHSLVFLLLVIAIVSAVGCSSGSKLAASGAPSEPVVPPQTLSLSGPSSTRLDSTVSMTAAGTGSGATLVWSVNGIVGGNNQLGAITTAGVYTAPSAMPSSQNVEVDCQQSDNPSIKASLSLALQNPIPVLSSAQVQRQPGSRFGITIAGSGFVAGSQILINGIAYPVTTTSSTSLTAVVAQTSVQKPTATINVSNPDPGSMVSGGLEVAVPLLLATPTAAARLLDQATFGPTRSDIQHLETVGLSQYIQEQLAVPATLVPEGILDYPQLPSYCSSSFLCWVEFNWWSIAITSPDQLRQRVAFAESHMWTVSMVNMDGRFMPAYLNTLSQDAFSNWRVLMEDMTLNGAMGSMLNMANNNYTNSGQIADQNFARELMQLFNLGPILLNSDGSSQVDSLGNAIPAYSLDQVKAFSRAFTGWTYDGSPYTCDRGYWNCPMINQAQYHDPGSKALLSGIELPAGQSGAQDLEGALDCIFAHPNLPPFVARRLIQQLVESNPTPAYIQRISDVFKDDGNGVRGNMTAVIVAILLDPEARQDDDPAVISPNGGRLREPNLWTASVLRGLESYSNVQDVSWAWATSQTAVTMGEVPFDAPNVFGFFSPNYILPDTTMTAPEFQLEDASTIFRRLLDSQQWTGEGNGPLGTLGGYGTLIVDLSITGPFGSAASQGADALLDQLDLVFMHGKMSTDQRSIIRGVIQGQDPGTMTRLAAYLIISSSAYKVQM